MAAAILETWGKDQDIFFVDNSEKDTDQAPEDPDLLAGIDMTGICARRIGCECWTDVFCKIGERNS